MEIIPYSYLDHNAILERIAGLLQAQNYVTAPMILRNWELNVMKKLHRR